MHRKTLLHLLVKENFNIAAAHKMMGLKQDQLGLLGFRWRRVSWLSYGLCASETTPRLYHIYKLYCVQSHVEYTMYIYICCEKLENFFSGEIGGSYSIAPVAVSVSLPSAAHSHGLRQRTTISPWWDPGGSFKRQLALWLYMVAWYSVRDSAHRMTRSYYCRLRVGTRCLTLFFCTHFCVI